MPLIAPPTPPQLEQDKTAIDTSFEKAFALLDQLATDTASLKSSEQTRTERLDAALSEVESVVGRMKEANEARELEAKRVARELAEIREQIPKAIEKEREGSDGRLRDLALEMKSLRTLVGNRMQQPPAQQHPSLRPVSNGVGYTPSAPVVNGNAGAAPQTNGLQAALASVPSISTEQQTGEAEKPVAAPSAQPTLHDRSTAASSPFGGRTLGAGGRAQIPAWQLAQKKRSEEAKKEEASSGTATPLQQDVSESGTVEGGAQ